MQIRHACIGASLALVVELLAATGAAQPGFVLPPPPVDDARAQLDEAERAFREGRYRDAAAAYSAADRLQPTPATQLALAKTYDKLDDTSRALAAYREYFARAPGAPDRAHVRERVDALALRLAERGVQQIFVSSEPSGASVAIDGKPHGIAPIYLDLPPGQHVVQLELEGFKPEAVEFELRLHEPLNVTTSLARAAPVVPAAVATAAAQPQPTAAAPEAAAAEQAPVAAVEKSDETKTWMTTLGLVALGGSVVALGTAVAFEVARDDSEDRAQQQDEQIAFKRDLDTASTQQTTARAFAITAGVLAATGGILLLLAAERGEASPNPGGVAVACTATECSALYRRVF